MVKLRRCYKTWFNSDVDALGIHFEDIRPHGVFHQEMRRLRNLQFLCSLWQLRFFLNVNSSSFKTPPALHSVAKCFAASTQHWCLWKNETLKTAGSYEPLRIHLQQRFFLRARVPRRLFVQKGTQRLQRLS